jgi:hypothetical protein
VLRDKRHRWKDDAITVINRKEDIASDSKMRGQNKRAQHKSPK